MPDFRVSDTAPEHPKLRAAGLAAAGLWAMAGGWCMQPTQLTDGWVPAYWVATWPGGTKAAAKLIQAGLWVKASRDGTPGYQFHDWADYQRTRAAVEDERSKARDRMRSVRSRGVRANTPVDKSPKTITKRSTSGVTEGPTRELVTQSTTLATPVDNPVTSGEGVEFARTSGARSPNVHDSLTLTHTHGSSGQGGKTFVGAHEPPPLRCPEHRDDPEPGPCGKCADARRTRERWTADQETRRAELAAALDTARADPRMRCAHGTDGGRYIRPDTGTSPCALCRAESTRDAS